MADVTAETAVEQFLVVGPEVCSVLRRGAQHGRGRFVKLSLVVVLPGAGELASRTMGRRSVLRFPD